MNKPGRPPKESPIDSIKPLINKVKPYMKHSPPPQIDTSKYPFDSNQTIKAVGFAKLPNVKGYFIPYTILIKDNQILNIEYGTPEYRSIVEGDSTKLYVNTILTQDSQ